MFYFTLGGKGAFGPFPLRPYGMHVASVEKMDPPPF